MAEDGCYSCCYGEVVVAGGQVLAILTARKALPQSRTRVRMPRPLAPERGDEQTVAMLGARGASVEVRPHVRYRGVAQVRTRPTATTGLQRAARSSSSWTSSSALSRTAPSALSRCTRARDSASAIDRSDDACRRGMRVAVFGFAVLIGCPSSLGTSGGAMGRVVYLALETLPTDWFSVAVLALASLNSWTSESSAGLEWALQIALDRDRNQPCGDSSARVRVRAGAGASPGRRPAGDDTRPGRSWRSEVPGDETLAEARPDAGRGFREPLGDQIDP